MNDRTTFRRYTKELLHHAVNVYSAASWAVALLGILPIWNDHTLPWLAVLFAVLSVVPASFRAWQVAVQAQPAPGELSILPKSAQVSPSIEGRLPGKSGHIDVRLDVSNPGSEPVDIAEVSVHAWGVPGDLFGGPGSLRVQGNNQHRSWGNLSLPIRLDPKDRRHDLAIFVEIQPRSEDALDFARTLMKHDDFSVTFRVRCENPARAASFIYVEARGSLVDYRDAAINVWDSQKHTDLLIAAGNLRRAR